jgi:probable HAF family extracellular repeat protein
VSVAYAINRAGQVAGESATTDNINFNHAFRWTPEGGLQDLGTLPGDTFSAAYGINDAGQVVGVSDISATGSTQRRAFLWTPGSGMQDLGIVGDYYSGARAINNAGQVVGGYIPAGASYNHAFLWTEGGGLQDLGTLSDDPVRRYSYAWSINNLGQVVGESGKAAWWYHAFSWTLGGGMQDLNLLTLPLPDPDKGWAAKVVNSSGWIAGNDVWEEYGFLLTPMPISSPAIPFLLLAD